MVYLDVGVSLGNITWILKWISKVWKGLLRDRTRYCPSIRRTWIRGSFPEILGRETKQFKKGTCSRIRLSGFKSYHSHSLSLCPWLLTFVMCRLKLAAAGPHRAAGDQVRSCLGAYAGAGDEAEMLFFPLSLPIPSRCSWGAVVWLGIRWLWREKSQGGSCSGVCCFSNMSRASGGHIPGPEPAAGMEEEGERQVRW